MARRILAALVVVGVVLMLSPDRLGGEPTTTSRPAAVATTTPSTTPPTSPPNPLEVYPRRPGAKYDDVEAPRNGSVTLATTLTIASTAIESRDSLAPRWRPARTSDAKTRGLADGYTTIVTDTRGAVLHVVVHEQGGYAGIPLLCSATAASDGTVLIPYYDGNTPPLPVAAPTTPGAAEPKSSDLTVYIPLGARRGRIYVGCQQLPFLVLTKGVYARAVWAIDV